MNIADPAALTIALAVALAVAIALAIRLRRRISTVERLYRTARQAEATALEECARLRQAIDSVPAGLVLLDRDERVVLASAGYGETCPGLAGVVTPGARFPELARSREGAVRHLRAENGPWEETLGDGTMSSS
jgi:PAS domain-containing protein